MPTINLRTSATVSLPAGQWVSTTGTGVAALGPGPDRGTQFPLQNQSQIGPFPYTVDVYLSSTATAIFYNVEQSPGMAPSITRDISGAASGLIDPETGAALLPFVPVDTPRDFRWTDHPLTLRRSASGIVTDFAITDYIPAITNIWYVDPVSGNDGTALVNTRAQPLKNLATALAKTDVDQIRVINLTGDFFARTSAGWNNIQPSRPLSVVVESGRFVSINAGSASLPTWAVNGTYSNVYSATISSASATGVTDLRTRAPHPDLVVSTSKHTEVLSAVARPFRVLKKVANLAAVAAEAGTWFHDGTQLHVRAHDDRSLVGDTSMQPTSNTNNGRYPAAVNNMSIYVQGVDFVGGRPFYATVAESAAPTGCTLYFNDCTFQGGGLANGLALEFNLTTYLYRCGAFYNWNDGFNYHCPTAPAAAGAATSPSIIEVECLAYGNGTTGSTAASDNASTAHEYTNAIRLNCVYPDSADRVLVDIDNVNSWNLAPYVGQAITVAAGKESVAALNACRMWLDSVVAPTGLNPLLASDATAIVRQYNSGNLTNTAGYTGSVRDYLG